MNDKWPPMSGEELQALLDELQADPAKAAAFKANLQRKMKAAIDRMPKRAVPLPQLISAAFSFLVAEHGFTEHQASRAGHLNLATIKEYSSDAVRIWIGVGGYDVAEFCSIVFAERQAGRRIEIHNWLAQRKVVFQRRLRARSEEQELSHLQAYAAAMKEHADELLRGDFSAVSD